MFFSFLLIFPLTKQTIFDAAKEKLDTLDRLKIIDISDDEQIIQRREEYLEAPVNESASSATLDEDLNYPEQPIEALKDTKKLQHPPTAAEIAATKRKIKNITVELNKELGLENEIASLTDKKPWKKFADYLDLHFDDLLVEGEISIQFSMRYFLCCFIVIYIPADFVFAIPSQIFHLLLPNEIMDIPILGNLIREIKIFLNFVKDDASKHFITFSYIGGQGTLRADFELFSSLPTLLFEDPMIFLRKMLVFEVRAPGYDEFKAHFEL